MSFTLQNVLIPTDTAYETVHVQLTDDRLTALAPDLPASGTVIDGSNKLLLPGFVNGHTHSSQIWQRGLIPQLPLELWLTCVQDAAQIALLEDFYLGAVSTAIDTLLSGGTCVMDHSYLLAGYELETVATLVRAYRDVGIRAFIAPLIQDQPLGVGLPTGRSQPAAASRSTTELLTLMEEIVKQFHRPQDGINIAMGPTGFHRCSDELLVGCSELSDRYQLCKHTHLLETRAQRLLAKERYGISAVEHLDKLGFLDSRTSLAHGVWLNDADMEILARTRSTIVHNPVSNLRLGSGIAPVLKYLQAGVNVGFGCDGAASNDAQDLLEAIKLGTILHTVTDPDYQNWLTPRQTLTMAASGGAKGVGLGHEAGSLTAGNLADIVLYDLTALAFLPQNDPIQTLILGRPNQVIDRVWVNGRQVVAAGQVMGVDIEQVGAKLRDRSRDRHLPPFHTIHQLEPTYRQNLLTKTPEV